MHYDIKQQAPSYYTSHYFKPKSFVLICVDESHIVLIYKMCTCVRAQSIAKLGQKKQLLYF